MLHRRVPVIKEVSAVRVVPAQARAADPAPARVVRAADPEAKIESAYPLDVMTLKVRYLTT
jgi:hypothetical protein